MFSRDASGEHRDILRHQRDAPAQRRGSASPTRTPSNETDTRRRVVEAQQQVEDRALAGAGGADDRDLLARPHRERHAVEHHGLGPRRIGEAHGLERDLAARAATAARRGLRRRLDLRLDRQAVRSSRSAAPAACESSPHTSLNCPSAARGEHRVEHELAERARRDASGEHVLRADPQDHHHAAEHQEDDDRGQRRRARASSDRAPSKARFDRRAEARCSRRSRW